LRDIVIGEDFLTRFLLGEIDERERAEVEDRLLSDQEFYEQILRAEGDLMDAYVREELSAREHERFEKIFFTSPRLRERVEFARGLAGAATRLHQDAGRQGTDAQLLASPSRSQGFLAFLLGTRPALSFAVAAAAVAVVGVAIWLAVERMRGPTEPQHARTEGVAPEKHVERPPDSPQNDSGVASRKQDAPLPQGSADATSEAGPTPEHDPARAGQAPPSRPVFATITLAAGSLRDGAGRNDIFIPTKATHVRVSLQLEEDNYQGYRAVMSTPEGRRVWSGAARKERLPNAHSVTLTLPARALQQGDYIIALSGAAAGGRFEPAAQYSFRVRQNLMR
jgi:hypothetical protein